MFFPNITAELPYNDYFEYFGPDFKLHISPTNMTNQNNREYLNKIKARLFENLRLIPHAPSVQMQGKLARFVYLVYEPSVFILVAIPEDGISDNEPVEDNIDARINRMFYLE